MLSTIAQFASDPAHFATGSIFTFLKIAVSSLSSTCEQTPMTCGFAFAAKPLSHSELTKEVDGTGLP